MKIHDKDTTKSRILDNDFWDNAKVIAETDKDIEFGSLIKINGKYYRTCCAEPIKGQKDKYARVAVSKVDYSATRKETCEEGHIVCPVCGNIDYDSFEVSEGDYQCPACSAELDVEIDYTVTYITTVKKGTKIVSL